MDARCASASFLSSLTSWWQEAVLALGNLSEAGTTYHTGYNAIDPPDITPLFSGQPPLEPATEMQATHSNQTSGESNTLTCKKQLPRLSTLAIIHSLSGACALHAPKEYGPMNVGSSNKEQVWLMLANDRPTTWPPQVVMTTHTGFGPSTTQ